MSSLSNDVMSAVVLLPLFKRAKLDKAIESSYRRQWYEIQHLKVTNQCPIEER